MSGFLKKNIMTEVSFDEFTAAVLSYIETEEPMLSNGNRTEWSPIRSVIIRVITKSDDHGAGV